MSAEIDTYGPRDLVGYGPTPPNPQWPGGAKIAISFVLNYEEGSEVTPVNGDPQSEHIASELGPGCKPIEGGRNVNIESLYEYGSRSGVWRILRLFKEYQYKLTSYAVAQALLKNPLVSKALLEDGHEVASHGWRWVDRSAWTEQEEEQYVHEAIDAILSETGQPPRGWYYGMVESKAGARSRAIVAKVFKERNLPLKYWSDDYSDDLPFWIPYPGTEQFSPEDKGLLIVPYALDTNDYKDGSHNSFLSPDAFFAYLKGAFDELYREGCQDKQPKMMSVGLHCRLVGRPGRMAGLRKFLKYIKGYEGVWVATREEIADHWAEKFPYGPKEA